MEMISEGKRVKVPVDKKGEKESPAAAVERQWGKWLADWVIGWTDGDGKIWVRNLGVGTGQ